MNKLPSLRQLQYLIALYDHQHFGHAATASFISQSTLSASITQLEETLDAQLLERDHKTFLFTPLGEEIVRRSRLLIEQAEELAAYAKNQEKPMQGKLHLGIIPTIAPFIITELHALCRRTYPDLTLFIKEVTTDAALKYLSQGKLDMVILALPYPTQNCHLRLLCKDYFQFVLPKQWLTKGLDRDISHLPEESLFLLEKDHCLTGHVLDGCQLRDSKKINPFFATSLHTLIQMVQYQSGVTYLPTLAIKGGILAGTKLASVPLKSTQAYREIGVAWRSTSFKAQRYNLLADLIEHLLIDPVFRNKPMNMG
jgi:LysR family hydrogen peroxide-inducible transcriptional activator